MLCRQTRGMRKTTMKDEVPYSIDAYHISHTFVERLLGFGPSLAQCIPCWLSGILIPSDPQLGRNLNFTNTNKKGDGDREEPILNTPEYGQKSESKTRPLILIVIRLVVH